MGKNSKRKLRPSPSYHFLWDTDNCWWCDNRQNCNSCKILKKRAVAERKHKSIQDLRFELQQTEYDS